MSWQEHPLIDIFSNDPSKQKNREISWKENEKNKRKKKQSDAEKTEIYKVTLTKEKFKKKD